MLTMRDSDAELLKENETMSLAPSKQDDSVEIYFENWLISIAISVKHTLKKLQSSVFDCYIPDI